MRPRKSFSRIRRLELVSEKLVQSLLAGNYRSVFRGPGIEFDEVREYVQGDDARLIDWNVSSRLGSAYTKTFREEREMTLFLLVDVSGSVVISPGGGMRKELENFLVALLSLAALRNNDKVGAAFFAERIEKWISPRKGKRHALRLLQDIMTFAPKSRGSNLSGALRTVGESLARRGICVVISDFKTRGYLRELSLLARRHDVIALRVSEPTDYDYPVSGGTFLQDPETGRTILATGRNAAFRKQYRDYWQRERLQWLRDCRRLGVSPLEVSTQDDPASKLIQFFKRRKRR